MQRQAVMIVIRGITPQLQQTVIHVMRQIITRQQIPVIALWHFQQHVYSVIRQIWDGNLQLTRSMMPKCFQFIRVGIAEHGHFVQIATRVLRIICCLIASIVMLMLTEVVIIQMLNVIVAIQSDQAIKRTI